MFNDFEAIFGNQGGTYCVCSAVKLNYYWNSVFNHRQNFALIFILIDKRMAIVLESRRDGDGLFLFE